MYKVSLIFPIYNVADFVKTSLLTALNQSFSSIEYILVDDCGTDNSMDIVQEIVNSHHRKTDVFIYKHTNNQGLSAARNTGLKHATGEYVFFMDSDDEITRDCIELHYNAIVHSRADFTVGFIKLLGTTSKHIINKDFGVLYERNILLAFLKGQFIETAWNKLYLRDFLLENKLLFIPGILHEDILWGTKISSLASVAVAVPKETYLYKVRSSSITTAKCSVKRLQSYIYIIKQLLLICDADAKNEVESRLYTEYTLKLQFTFALLLQISDLSYSNRKKFYYEVSSLNPYKRGKYALALKLPYCLFVLLFNLPYKIYKHLK